MLRRCCACRAWPRNRPSDTALRGRGQMRSRRRRRRSTPRMGRTMNLTNPRWTTTRGATGDAGAVAPRPSLPLPPSQCGRAMWCPLTRSRRIAARTSDRTSRRTSNCGARPTTRCRRRRDVVISYDTILYFWSKIFQVWLFCLHT